MTAATAGILGLILIGAVAWGGTKPERILIPTALLLPSGDFVGTFQVKLGSHGYLTFLQVTAIAVFVVNLVGRQQQGEWRTNTAVPAAFAFMIAGTLAAIGSNAVEKSFYFVIATGLVFLCLVFVLFQRLRENPRSVHQTVIVSALASAVVVLVEWKVHHSIIETYLVRHDPDYIPAWTPGYRPPGLTGNALTTSSSIVVAYGVALVTPFLHRLRVVVLTVLAAGASVTLSRSAILLIGAATFIFMAAGWMRREPVHQRTRRAVAFVVVPVLIVGMIFLLPRIDRRLAGQPLFSSTGRENNGLHALHLVVADPRPTGLGLGGYKRLVISEGLANDTNVPATIDDQWLTYLLELGWFGELVMLGGIVIGWRRRERVRGLMWLPLAIAIGVGFTFESMEHDAPMMMTAVALGLATVATRKEGESGLAVAGRTYYESRSRARLASLGSAGLRAEGRVSTPGAKGDGE